MKYLSICIPNYNRLEKLEKLIHSCATQITNSLLVQEVEICISDDCSPEAPSDMIARMQKTYPDISFRYVRNEVNKGMDYNFLNSVLISNSLYCWIIGNDDLPEENGILQVVTYLKSKSEQIDILITPFNVYAEDDEYRATVYPFGNTGNEPLSFDTEMISEYQNLIKNVQHNSALFGFLSNVVFKRENWKKYEERFQDKLNSIFIQMYMNIQTLEDGAKVEYVPWKMIRNYADDETNSSIDRICKILFGLDGVVEYFFQGREREYLKRVIVDAYISGIVWELPDEHEYKERVRKVVSGKNFLYEKYFVPIERRKHFFEGKNVIIYGAGNYGRKVYNELKDYKACLDAVVDSDERKWGSQFEEHVIESIGNVMEIYHKNESCVVVASYYGVEEMVYTLWKNNVERIAIIT